MSRAAVILGKFLLGILSVIVCILLFVSVIATVLIADVGTVVSKDGLQTLILQMLSPSEDLQNSSGNSTTAASPVVEWAYDSLQQQYGDQLPMEMEELQELVDQSTIKDFLAEKTASFANDLYTGNATTTITLEEIVAILTENKDIINKYFPSLDLSTPQAIDALAHKILAHELTQQLLEQGAEAFLELEEEDLADAAADMPRTQAVKGTAVMAAAHVPTFQAAGLSGIKDALQLVRTVTSPTALLLAVGLCLALLGLLFLFAWNRPYNAMIEGGITVLLAGSLLLIPTVVAWLMPGTWLGLFGDVPMVGQLSRQVLMLTGGVCGGVSALGIGLIVGGGVLKHRMRKGKPAAAAPCLTPEETEIPAEETL